MQKRAIPILYINQTAVHGGAEEVLLHTMRATRQQGYTPLLVVPAEGWLTTQCRAAHIPCILLPSLPNIVVSDTWQQQFKPWLLNGIALAQIIRNYKVKLVHANTPRAAYHGGLAARIARIPIVNHCHDMLTLPYSSPPKARLLNALSDAIITVSDAVATVVQQFAPYLAPKITRIYNGLPPSQYDAVFPADLRPFGITDECFVIGSVSAMAPLKGQDVLIEAFALIHERLPQLRLVIVGGAHGNQQQQGYERQLWERVAALGLQEKIVFTGWREDVWSLLGSFDVFAHVPTLADSLPTVLLHASALGRPNVASRIGGIPEIVVDGATGWLVPPSDAPALADKLAQLVAQPEQRIAFGKAAQKHFLETFSFEEMARNLGQLYKRVLS